MIDDLHGDLPILGVRQGYTNSRAPFLKPQANVFASFWAVKPVASRGLPSFAFLFVESLHRLIEGRPIAFRAKGAEHALELPSELRAHSLIRKVPHTHRYVLTDQGRLAIAALLAARNANALELAKLAA